MPTNPAAAADLPAEMDVAVVGSGCAALAAAIAARVKGLDVVILEKEPWFGGTTSLSGAAMWLPLSAQARAAGIEDTREGVLRYLEAVVGDAAPADLRAAFVDHAAEALTFFETHSELAYDLRAVAPDYHPEAEGAAETGRVLDVRDYDGRRLGPRFADLRPPLDTHLVFGGMMVNRRDVAALLRVGRSREATLHALRLVGRYAIDRLRHGRGTRLVVGSALVARLAATVFDLRIPLFLRCPATALVRGPSGGVSGVIASAEGGPSRRILARRGVVLATGGFSGDPVLSAANRPGSVAPHYGMPPKACAGDGIRLGISAGGEFGESPASSFFWAPVSVLVTPDGARRQFAHLTLDRAKPGVIAIDRTGRRFTNEADSYHRFGAALQPLCRTAPADPPAWLLCDAKALRAYGLGLARPFPAHRGNKALIRAGYLVEAESLTALAARLGVPAEALAETVAAHDAAALIGVDKAFGKGASAHNRALGDPVVKPNPCLAPIVQPPFYAVAVHSGDLGTARGLTTDRHARVLDGSGRPVPGLYAVGNDMRSIMGGTYPGAGITLGPALVFAYLAASHLAAGPAMAAGTRRPESAA